MNSLDIAIAEENHRKMKQLKKDLKAWEQAFSQAHGFKPTKHDIANVPEIEIRYKVYAKLKKLEADVSSIEKEAKDPNLSSSQTLSDTQPKIITQLPRHDEATTPVDVSPIKINDDSQMSSTPPKMPRPKTAATSPDHTIPQSQPRPRTANAAVNVLSGPVLKEDLGSTTNKFMQLLAEKRRIAELNKKQINDDNTVEIKTYQKYDYNGKDDANNETNEMRELRERKEAIKAMAYQHSYADETQKAQTGAQESVSAQSPPVLDDPVVIQLEEIPSQTMLNSKSAESLNSITPMPITVVDQVQEELESDTYDKDMAAFIRNEAMNADETSIISEKLPPMEIPAPQKSTGQNQIVKNIPSLPVDDVFSRCDSKGILRCRFTRKTNLLSKAQPQYLLQNELDGKLIMSAQKVIMSKKVYYVINDHQNRQIGKLKYLNLNRANFMRTVFILHDARSPSPRELAYISYVLFIK